MINDSVHENHLFIFSASLENLPSLDAMVDTLLVHMLSPGLISQICRGFFFYPSKFSARLSKK